MQVKLLSKEKILFSGPASSVTSTNSVGTFDILENHANFISLITKEIILDKGQKSEKVFPIERGVLKSSKNLVEIFL